MTMPAATAPGQSKVGTGEHKPKSANKLYKDVVKAATASPPTGAAPRRDSENHAHKARSPLGQDLVAAAMSPKSPGAVARTADAARLPVGNASPSGCMVVEVDDAIARIVPMLGASCGVCQTDCANGKGNTVIEGRPVCEACKVLFNTSGFVPEHRVCINPLCRRKWKQRSPKVLPIFCPPCKRQLEEGVAGGPTAPEATLLQQICRHWRSIWKELAEAIPEVLETGPPVSDGPTEELEEREEGWREDVLAFKESFPTPSCSEDVRNWNSVHGRRRHYRGVIRRRYDRFVCEVEVEEELESDLLTARKATTPGQCFPLIDWRGSLQDGKEVHFAVFPNPAVSERGAVGKIVQLLSGPESAVEGPGTINETTTSCIKVPPTEPPDWDAVVAPPENTNEDAMNLAASFGSFDDLVQWSQDDSAFSGPAGGPARGAPSPNGPEELVNGGAPRVNLFLEVALQLDQGGQPVGQPPPENVGPGLRPRGKGMRSSPRGGFASHNNGMVHQVGSKGKSPKFSPFLAGAMARSPMLCPRSPYAAYFDD